MSNLFKSIPIIFLAFFLSSHLQGQEKNREPLPDIDAFLSDKNVATKSGVIPVFYNENRVYVEISSHLLEKELLIAAKIDSGHDLHNRLLNHIGCVFFTKGYGNSLHLHQVGAPERATVSELKPQIAKSNFVPIVKKYDILGFSSEKNSFLIDISDDVLNGSDWFSASSDLKLRGLKFNLSTFRQAETIKNGVVLQVKRMYGASPSPIQGTEPVITPDGYAPVFISCVLQVLSTEKMSPRNADSRIGFSSNKFTNYGKFPFGAIQDSVVQRWNLPRLKGKIDVVIHPRFTKMEKTSIKNAVEQWNLAFRKANYPDALRVREQTENNDWEGQILISFDRDNEIISSEKIVHPETGEILYAFINVNTSELPQFIDMYFLSTGNFFSTEKEGEKVKNAVLQSLLIKEIGKVLGLKDNFAGSSAYPFRSISDYRWLQTNNYTASVMDANPYNYALSAKVNSTDFSMRVPLKIGAYDMFAIDWAYNAKNFHKQELRSEITQAIAQNDYFFSDDVSDLNSQKHDLAADKLNALEQGMKNLQQAFGDMENYLYPDKMVNDKGEKLLKMQKKGVDLYTNYLDICSAYIGGFKSGKPVSKQEAKDAMMFIDKYLFRFNSQYFRTPYLNRSPLWDNSEQKILDYTSLLFEKLLSEETITALSDAVYYSDSYNIELFRNDIYTHLFFGFDTEITFSPYTMNLQYRFLQALNKRMAAAGKTTNSYTYQLSKWKDELLQKLKAQQQSENEDLKAHSAILMRVLS